MNQKFIQDYCEKKGYTSRACRFQVISELMGISPEEAVQVESITRYIRNIFPKDEVGARKEEERLGELGYQTSPKVAIHDQEAHERISKTQGSMFSLNRLNE